MQSLEIWLLKRFMVKPELARELPIERLGGDRLESAALQAFVAFAREFAGPNFDALVIDRFQGTEFEGLLKQMRSEAMVLNLTPEQVEAEYRNALPNLERLHVKEQLSELQRAAALRELSDEERARMAALAKQLGSLDASPTGTPPVL